MVPRIVALVLALTAVAHADPAEPARGFTLELGMGMGAIKFPESSTIGLGLSGGIGGFITHDVALTLRVSGIDRAGYTGLIGPHVQVWLGDDVFVGVGGGLGFYALCDVVYGCSTGDAPGGTARIGIVATRIGLTHVSMSVEATAMKPDSVGVIQTYSLLVGGQTF
jgi:hypothetical protein